MLSPSCNVKVIMQREENIVMKHGVLEVPGAMLYYEVRG